MDALESDYIEYQDANRLRLKNELIHEYVRFHLTKYRHFKRVVVRHVGEILKFTQKIFCNVTFSFFT